MKVPTFLFSLFLLVVPNLLFCEETGSSGVQPDGHTVQQVENMLATAKLALTSLPADARDDSPEGQKRIFTTRRIILSSEYIDLANRRKSTAERRSSFDGRLREANALLSQLESAPPPTAPKLPDRAGFDQLGIQLNKAREKVGLVKEAIRTNQTRVSSVSSQSAEAGTRASEASKRATALGNQLAGESDEGARRLTEFRIENARLDRQIGLDLTEFIQEDVDAANASLPVLAKELLVSEKQLARLEAEFELYGKSLHSDIEKSRIQLENNLAKDERQALKANTPDARLFAEWKTRIGLSRKLQSNVEGQLVVLRKEVADQRKRLAAEEEDLASLRDLLEQGGNSSRASERIKKVFRNLERRRTSLQASSRAGFEADLEAERSRRFEIDDVLIDLPERSAEELSLVLESLTEPEQVSLQNSADALLTEFKSALRDEKGVLTEAISEGQNLQTVLAKRYKILVETDRFIRTKAFWLRDAASLPFALIEGSGGEIKYLRTWVNRLSIPFSIELLGNFLIFLIIIPIMLILLRKKLYALTKHDSPGIPMSLGRRLLMIFTELFTAVLIPAYVKLLSLVTAASGDPGATQVLSSVLDHLSYFIILFLLARLLFREEGIAYLHFGLSSESTSALYRATSVIALAHGFFLLPWHVLTAPPFELVNLPRLAYSLFEISAGVALLWLFRQKSAIFAAEEGKEAVRGWRAYNYEFTWLLRSLILAILTLDLVGYRYSAQQLGQSLMETLLILLALPALHLIAQSALTSAARQLATAGRPAKRVPAETEAQIETSRGASEEAPGPALERIRTATRFIFILLGVILLARCWGIDAGGLDALNRIQILSTLSASGVESTVTGADVFRCILILGVTMELNIYLPALFRTFIYPRLGLDTGLNYAILTLLRYSLILIGTIIALTAVHIDLGSLGWLMGALSVGIGFGLQEIVSNFVCGLILLIERPVRVGDVVTVGGKTGTVTRINIRATTILNYDRQEEILPNRSFITGDVTNWTRGDTINRVVISIGVAYGSDVDAVTKLLMKVAKDAPKVLSDPPPSVVFIDHGDSALLFNLRTFVPSPDELFTTRDHLNKAINKALAAADIEIPFPQRDLHIKSSNVPFVMSKVDSGEELSKVDSGEEN
jgi:potassium efflux system protein